MRKKGQLLSFQQREFADFLQRKERLLGLKRILDFACAYKIDLENVGKTRISNVVVITKDETQLPFEAGDIKKLRALVPGKDGRYSLGDMLPLEQRSIAVLARYGCGNRAIVGDTDFGIKIVHDGGVARFNYFPDFSTPDRFIIEHLFWIYLLTCGGVIFAAVVILATLQGIWKMAFGSTNTPTTGAAETSSAPTTTSSATIPTDTSKERDG